MKDNYGRGNGMILIFAGVVILLLALCFFRDSIAAYFLAIGLVLFGIFIPFHGYHEPVLEKEYDLIALRPESEIYAIVDSDGSVTCKMIGEKEHKEMIDKEVMYTYSGTVEVVPTEENTKPVLKKYISEPKRSEFTMAKCGNDVKWVFFMPEKNIERWENEHVN